jgi:hypothetical protein
MADGDMMWDGAPLPDTLRLKPGRAKWLGVFAISAAFVAIAVWLGPGDPVLFYGCGGFFLVCALVALPQMIGVGASLTLDRKGFECRTLFKSFRREWRDCSEFAPRRIFLNTFVAFETRQDIANHPNLSELNRQLVGASGALPDTFGLPLDELTDLMNAFRARALAEAR